MSDEKNSAYVSKLISQVKISNCRPSKHKYNAKRDLVNTVYEDSNPLRDDIFKSGRQNPKIQPRALENIPIIGSSMSNESNIKFSFSTPQKLNDLSPILAKWTPKMNNIVSIIEDLIDSPDDDEDRNDEDTDSNHVVYIDEDLVKREEFVDENSVESFDSESNENSRNGKELTCSFDEEKKKKEFHINDTLRIKLHKLNFNGNSINDYKLNSTSQSKIHCGTSSKNAAASSSKKKKKLSNKYSHRNKSLRSSKTSLNDQHREASHCNTKSKRATSLESKSQSRTSDQSTSSYRRQSLRLSGKSSEIKLPEDVPSLTRNGRKRVYEEVKNRSISPPSVSLIDGTEISHHASKTRVGEGSNAKNIPRSRSPSPSKYRKKVEIFFVCQCCDKKYDSVEKVKVHIGTHFPNCATN